MRFLSAILFVALSGSGVLADEAKTAEPKPEPTPEQTKPKIPLRIVRMLPDTGQALLFDKVNGTHIVAELGTPLEGGYIVEDIGDNDVTLSTEDGSLIVLAGPEKKKKAKAPAAAPQGTATAVTDTPVDPYAAAPATPTTTTTTATTTTAPAAPTVTATTTVTVAPTGAAPPAAVTTTPTAAAPKAPTATPPTAATNVNAGSPALVNTSDLEPGIAAFVEAVGAVPAPGTAPTAAPASPPSISTTISPTAAAPAAATQAGTPIVAALKRTEVDAALGDFSQLAASFKGVFTAKGLRFDSIVPGSLLARAGFMAGDLVMSVDGKPLRSLDDAADLYALAWTSNSATVQVQRGGKTTSLRLAIQ